MNAIVVVGESGEDFGAGAGVDDQVDIDAALAKIFEEEPGEAAFAAVLERGVLGDHADFHCVKGHLSLVICHWYRRFRIFLQMTNDK